MFRKRIIISGFRHSRTFVIAQGTLIACDVCKLREITAIMAGCSSDECSEISMSGNVRAAGLYENSAGQKKLTPDLQSQLSIKYTQYLSSLQLFYFN